MNACYEIYFYILNIYIKAHINSEWGYVTSLLFVKKKAKNLDLKACFSLWQVVSSKK